MNMIDANTADAVLWLEVKQHDRRAYRILFDRYGSTLYRSAFRLLHDREASETIAHDIFLNLWLKRETLDIRDFRSYIMTATRYHVYKALRAQQSSPVTTVENEQMEGLSSIIMNTAEEKMAEQTVRELIRQHVNGLPRRCREIFLLSREQHLSNQEIAERLNISRRSVENQITFALRHLRMHLKEYSLLATILLEV